jgi:hypothetical protein
VRDEQEREREKRHNDIVSVVGLWRCTPKCGEAHEHASRHDTCAGSKCWKSNSLERCASAAMLETALAREMRASWTSALEVRACHAWIHQ